MHEMTLVIRPATNEHAENFKTK